MQDHDASSPAFTPYAGHERRRHPPALQVWLTRALDLTDYGMLLLDEDSRVVHANLAARAELDADHPLQLHGRALRAGHPGDAALLQDALAAATRRGLQRMITLGRPDDRVAIAVLPLSGIDTLTEALGGITLVMLGKRHVCEPLSVQWFARTHGLTAAEARVLAALCRGTPPADIAREHGVGLATVRTQIGAARAKTGTPSIRALVDMVARLPPMVGALRAARARDTMPAWARPEPPIGN